MQNETEPRVLTKLNRNRTKPEFFKTKTKVEEQFWTSPTNLPNESINQSMKHILQMIACSAEHQMLNKLWRIQLSALMVSHSLTTDVWTNITLTTNLATGSSHITSTICEGWVWWSAADSNERCYKQKLELKYCYRYDS